MSSEYKRLEIYTGWKCNHKCVFCIEYPNMEIHWDDEVTEHEIMKKLIKYRKLAYNHVTFLGGEPFIHSILSFATTFAKKIGYTTMVTTNASTLQFENQAKKHLSTIDQIIVSLPIVDKKIQTIINDTKGIIDFDNVFLNINKYWEGNFLKINTVINQYNLEEIGNIIHFVGKKGVKEMSITYPDLTIYYSMKHIKQKIAPTYTAVKIYIDEWVRIAKEYNINLKITDIPFCCLPGEEFIPYTDDYCYETRLKINSDNQKISRDEFLPRKRRKVKNCEGCVYGDTCWGPAYHYKNIYGLNEIKAYSRQNIELNGSDFLHGQEGAA